MKKIYENEAGNAAERITFMQVWQNQPPIMYWWFAFSSISLCSVYILLLTKL